MTRVLIIGAAGHAQVIADILMRSVAHGQMYEPVGYLDDDASLHGQLRLGLPVLGSTADISFIPHDAVIVGIGDNLVRYRLFRWLCEHGEKFVVAIHPSAVIAHSASIDKGTVVAAGAIVNPGSVVGENVILNTACSLDHHNHIGGHAHIGPGAHLGGDVHVGEGAFVGIGASVMPQRKIGRWSIVGAGCVVNKPVPDLAVVAGVPARLIRRIVLTPDLKSG